MKDTWDRVCVDTAEEGALGCDEITPFGVVDRLMLTDDERYASGL